MGRSPVKNGFKEGKFSSFYESGFLRQEMTYKKDVLIGWVYRYHENGVLQEGT
ncbi:MAG: hypothetical protein IPG53_06435 [Ignavibacteriales bacterium]|nr:hypothetical protein [Ignavibacteriales bacterium]